MTVRRRLAASVLVFESFVVLFAIAVAVQIAGVAPSTAGWVGGSLAAACLVVAGLLRHRWAFVLGTLLQVAVIATGFVVPTMWVLGGIFALLWWLALHLGAKAVEIDRERAAGRGADIAGPAQGPPATP